jgi:DNA-directed RNA polymerase II subunit RPB2
MEIHPSLVLGVLASCIPFPDHNQSPQTLPIGYGKQAVGLHTRFFRHRMDTGIRHGLRTTTHREQQSGDMMGCSEMPSGINVIVAISTLGLQSGRRSYPQQDFAERGLFTSTLQYPVRLYEEHHHRRGAVLPPVRRTGRGQVVRLQQDHRHWLSGNRYLCQSQRRRHCEHAKQAKRNATRVTR